MPNGCPQMQDKAPVSYSLFVDGHGYCEQNSISNIQQHQKQSFKHTHGYTCQYKATKQVNMWYGAGIYMHLSKTTTQR